MNITSVVVENIKGFSHFELNDQSILPNRPNILVAPNGFGKTSLATAFLYLKRGNISLKQEDCYLEDLTMEPCVKLSLSTGNTYVADKNKNEISSCFDVHVVNNQLIPNAKAKHFGNVTTAKATLDISPTIVFRKIPKFVRFEYDYSEVKRHFGTANKVLPNISSLYKNFVFIQQIEESIVNPGFFKLKDYKNAAERAVNTINSWSSYTTIIIKQKIREENIFSEFPSEFLNLVEVIKKLLQYENIVDAYLASWQYVVVKIKMGESSFKKALNYTEYLKQKSQINETIRSLNPVQDRFDIKTSEKNSQLVIEWPKAHQISNGQRDIMVFVSKLIECEYQSKNNCILVIDEFFDYLDDANLVAFQYYISNLIDRYKKQKRLIFPILLTHLDPHFLNHFCFNDSRLNVCYLKKTNAIISKVMEKFVQNREDSLVKDVLDKYFFHYHPDYQKPELNYYDSFEKLGLNLDWSKPSVFRKKTDRQLRTYLLEDSKTYDPLAVCFSIRVRIEEIVYSKIEKEDVKQDFINMHGTTEKLLYAQKNGISFPETYFLLGIIYNHPLHEGNVSMSRQLGMKFENLVIKNMIMKLWE